MPSNPLTMLGTLYHHFTHNKAVRRDDQRIKRRQKATAAWNARLRSVRSSDEICLAKIDASTQLNSLFFRKLPLELRRLVYAHVLGGQELCLRVVNENEKHDGDEIGKEGVPFKLECRAARGLLALPMSCKLAYVFTWILPRGVFASCRTDYVPGTRSRWYISTPATHSASLASQRIGVSSGFCLANL